MRKSVFLVLLSAIILFTALPVPALAEYNQEITAKHAILMDADTGAVLYEKDAGTRAYPASTTKIMTCLVVLETATDLDEMVTVGEEVRRFSAANSLMGLKENVIIGKLIPAGSGVSDYCTGHYEQNVNLD